MNHNKIDNSTQSELTIVLRSLQHSVHALNGRIHEDTSLISLRLTRTVYGVVGAGACFVLVQIITIMSILEINHPTMDGNLDELHNVVIETNKISIVPKDENNLAAELVEHLPEASEVVPQETTDDLTLAPVSERIESQNQKYITPFPARGTLKSENSKKEYSIVKALAPRKIETSANSDLTDEQILAYDDDKINAGDELLTINVD